MIVYLSGPMRAHHRFNIPLFKSVAQELRRQGVDVLSPADYETEDDAVLPVETYAKRDFDLILQAKAVAVLPDWESSAGARAEVALAQWCGYPIYDAITLLRVGPQRSGEQAEIFPAIKAETIR